MWSIQRASYKPFFLMVSLAALLILMLAACVGTGGIGSTPTPIPTSVFTIVVK